MVNFVGICVYVCIVVFFVYLCLCLCLSLFFCFLTKNKKTNKKRHETLFTEKKRHYMHTYYALFKYTHSKHNIKTILITIYYLFFFSLSFFVFCFLFVLCALISFFLCFFLGVLFLYCICNKQNTQAVVATTK